MKVFKIFFLISSFFFFVKGLPLILNFKTTRRPKRYSKETLVRAIRAVLEEGMAIRYAARIYNVPRSTINLRISAIKKNNLINNYQEDF